MNAPPLDPKSAFADAAAIASYADRTRRLVPGWDDLQKMVTLLVAERAPAGARILVVGAGGGAELDALARSEAGWRFVGVDPSAPMLDLARATLGPRADRVEFHEGYVATAAAGPFDAATCLLTMHFVPRDERLPTLREIQRRLKPGAPFVMAHMSFPQDADERATWLARYASFAIASGVEPGAARRAAAAIGGALPLVAPADEEALLAQAGFSGTRLFYAGLAFRGWVANG
ncbi:MAG: class I SAM-dependent methyltransferase [Burkholderiaceae bacterium]